MQGFQVEGIPHGMESSQKARRTFESTEAAQTSKATKAAETT
jgi:hypothetical protein